MTVRVDTLTSIRVFRQVVESGSFVAAAERLDLSTAMVSKHVMHIEKRLGVRLLNRNSRTLSLTEPGKVYFERGKTILDDLEDAELELRSLNSAPRGTLRITAPSWFAFQMFADMLAEYRRRYPEIVVDVSLEDRLVDLVEEGFDLALRVTADSPPARGYRQSGLVEVRHRQGSSGDACARRCALSHGGRRGECRRGGHRHRTAPQHPFFRSGL